MAKYLVETYYTCNFKVSHYLDDINETEIKNLESELDELKAPFNQEGISEVDIIYVTRIQEERAAIGY